MLEMDGKRVYAISNNKGIIQGTVSASDALIKSNSRVEIRLVGQINEIDEAELVEELEKVIKKFYL